MGQTVGRHSRESGNPGAAVEALAPCSGRGRPWLEQGAAMGPVRGGDGKVFNRWLILLQPVVCFDQVGKQAALGHAAKKATVHRTPANVSRAVRTELNAWARCLSLVRHAQPAWRSEWLGATRSYPSAVIIDWRAGFDAPDLEAAKRYLETVYEPAVTADAELDVRLMDGSGNEV